MKLPTIVLALLATAISVQATGNVAAMGDLATNNSPEFDSVDGLERQQGDDLEAQVCRPPKPLQCLNGGCCAAAYPRCCPTVCSPEKYPYCGRVGKCYAQ